MDIRKYSCEKCGGDHPTEAHVASKNFIREPSLEQTLERMREIEPSKRKIIVYVGVHPNEGTDVLVEKYASEWADKYGATIVCQPAEETPHAIWEKRKQEAVDGAVASLPPDVILDEEDYADKFSFDNKDTFVILFHGTPLRYFKDPNRPRGLGVETSRYSDHPEDFKDRRHPIAFSNPAIAEGLGEELSRSNTEDVKNVVEVEEHQDDPLWYPYSPNTLVVEYFYKGKPTQIDDPYIKKLVEFESDDNLGLLSKENWHRQMNIDPSYLNQDVLTDEDIQAFNSTVVKDFKKILQHISRRLPGG